MDQTFSNKLLTWHGDGKRDMPWKKTKDPYRIWISEIILQQTRVSQGYDYYLKFIERFPNVRVLAAASEDDVLSLWKGLGYYTRARNIHHTAKHIVNELNAQFPTTYEEILSLKGIGPYSAAAIASFAFDLPHAVADGNVYRVLSRYFGLQESIDLPKVKKQLSEKANELIDPEAPASFNQAIMDLGALICTPRNVSCNDCPLSGECIAYEKDMVDKLPIRSPKPRKRNRYFHYLVISNGDRLLMKKRNGQDIWKGLYDFPCIETDQIAELKEADWKRFCAEQKIEINTPHFPQASKIQSQNLTHQKVHGSFYSVKGEPISYDNHTYQLIKEKELDKIAVPKLIDWYLNDKTITLI